MQKPTYIQFLGIKKNVPITYCQLCPKQRENIAKWLHSGCNLKIIALFIAHQLVVGNNIFHKIIAYFAELFLLETYFLTIKPFADALLHQTKQLITPYGILFRDEKITFVEFINLHAPFVHNQCF